MSSKTVHEASLLDINSFNIAGVVIPLTCSLFTCVRSSQYFQPFCHVADRLAGQRSRAETCGPFLQALYLSQQYPFINGEGALLDTLTPTETTVVPQINFAPPDLPNIGYLESRLNSGTHIQLLGLSKIGAWRRQSMHVFILNKISSSRCGQN